MLWLELCAGDDVVEAPLVPFINVDILDRPCFHGPCFKNCDFLLC